MLDTDHSCGYVRGYTFNMLQAIENIIGKHEDLVLINTASRWTVCHPKFQVQGGSDGMITSQKGLVRASQGMKPFTVGEKSIREKSIREKSIREKSIREKSIREKSIREKSLLTTIDSARATRKIFL
ncbi:hypothetical protein DL770_002168 [Monosporascus sp. CRB-9-2]|nr:hypothetical protein DL770_002168 [Monosporascus sp. CRB-9-2]